MARAGYCQHGTYIGNNKDREIEIDGKKITLPGVGCHECAEEERKRKEKRDRFKKQEEAYVETEELAKWKENFITLLEGDPEFRGRVKSIILADVPSALEISRMPRLEDMKF